MQSLLVAHDTTLGSLTKMLGSATKAAFALAALSLAGVTAGAVVSCGAEEATPVAAQPDAASVSDSSAPGADALVDGAGVEAAVMCELGIVPALPAVTSEVLIEGSDGGIPPTPIGGDEDGLWAYTKINVYLPALAQGQIDPSMSKVDGKGFIELHGNKFRQLSDTTTVISTAAAGKVTRAATAKALGSYAIAGTALTFTPTCTETSSMGSALGTVDFSRVDATHARLHVITMSQLGTAKLVIDMEKQP